VKTISTYRARLLEKMAMSNNSELTHYAIQNQLVEKAAPQAPTIIPEAQPALATGAGPVSGTAPSPQSRADARQGEGKPGG
jgi:hypothetical protein